MAGGKKKSKHDRPKTDRAKNHDKKAVVADAGPVKPKRSAPVADVATTDGDIDASIAEPAAVTSVGTLSVEPSRRGPLTEMVPVRFDKEMLADVRTRAADDHRSVSSWIRRAVDLELQRGS